MSRPKATSAARQAMKMMRGRMMRAGTVPMSFSPRAECSPGARRVRPRAARPVREPASPAEPASCRSSAAARIVGFAMGITRARRGPPRVP